MTGDKEGKPRILAEENADEGETCGGPEGGNHSIRGSPITGHGCTRGEESHQKNMPERRCGVRGYDDVICLIQRSAGVTAMINSPLNYCIILWMCTKCLSPVMNSSMSDVLSLVYFV